MELLPNLEPIQTTTFNLESVPYTGLLQHLNEHNGGKISTRVLLPLVREINGHIARREALAAYFMGVDYKADAHPEWVVNAFGQADIKTSGVFTIFALGHSGGGKSTVLGEIRRVLESAELASGYQIRVVESTFSEAALDAQRKGRIPLSRVLGRTTDSGLAVELSARHRRYSSWAYERISRHLSASKEERLLPFVKRSAELGNKVVYVDLRDPSTPTIFPKENGGWLGKNDRGISDLAWHGQISILRETTRIIVLLSDDETRQHSMAERGKLLQATIETLPEVASELGIIILNAEGGTVDLNALDDADKEKLLVKLKNVGAPPGSILRSWSEYRRIVLLLRKEGILAKNSTQRSFYRKLLTGCGYRDSRFVIADNPFEAAALNASTEIQSLRRVNALESLSVFDPIFDPIP